MQADTHWPSLGIGKYEHAAENVPTFRLLQKNFLTSDAKVIFKKFYIFKRMPLKITIIEMTLKFKV